MKILTRKGQNLSHGSLKIGILTLIYWIKFKMMSTGHLLGIYIKDGKIWVDKSNQMCISIPKNTP